MATALLHVEFINETEFRRDLDRAVGEISDGTTRGVRMGLDEGADEARASRAFKDRTGDLRKSIRGIIETSTRGGAVGFLEARVPYASFVEEGTEPHVIRPKAPSGTPKSKRLPGQGVRAKTDIGTHRVALRWYDEGGGIHFAREVHHPGSKPHPFIGPALQKTERVIYREVELGVNRAQHILDS